MTRTAACVLAVAAALALPGCGSDDEEPSKASQTATPAATKDSDRGYGY